MAQIKRIEILLDKYWAGKTTVQEEKELKNYFNSDDVAEHLEYVAPLFKVLKSDEEHALDQTFDEKVKVRLRNNQGQTSSGGQGWSGTWMRYAASILIFMAVGFIAYLQLPRVNQNVEVATTQQDTFETPEEAYAHVKQSLMLVSTKLNKGNNYVNELNRLNTGASLFNKQKQQKDEN